MDFQAVGASFGLLLVMELGDKTQLAVLTLTARTGQVLAVFIGAVLGLMTVTLVGVAAGAVMEEFIPMGWLSHLAGLSFIAIGGFMLWSSHLGSSEKGGGEEVGVTGSKARGPLGTLAVSFSLLLVAEMGDKSQLAVIGMTAKTGSPLSVFLGASAALALVTLLGVLAGKVVTRIIPVRWFSRGTALLFIVIGSLTLAGIF